MNRCRRCSGSVIAERFVAPDARGTRFVCLLCADQVEQIDNELGLSRAELRRVAAEPRRSAGRPRKTG